jgi:hypothetical protein
LLVKTIREMISPNHREGIDLEELLKRLEPFECQLNSESANRVSFGNTSLFEREVDQPSLNNSHINALSEAVKLENQSLRLGSSFAFRKEEESVNEDALCIL